jgi:hypothetical protein
MRILPLIPIVLSFWLAACCEPSHKDSQPLIVADSFQETYGKDLDVYTAQGGRSDSAYFPIYTFGIKNTGSQDDNFTLQLRKPLVGGFVGGFDITKRVPAGQTVMFRTPSPIYDSSAHYFFPHIQDPNDTFPIMDKAYYGIQASTPDSTKLHILQPTLTITYGEINNGPEACNTAASTQTIDLNSLPRR